MKYYSVSVIITTYNNGHFIKDALGSVFRQNYHEELVEIIVVDDGSTDNTREIVKKYKDKIIYVYQENKGIASARNTGISHAKGEIITFLDSDDIWHEDRLLRVMEKFNERQDTGIVYHPFEVIDSRGLVIYRNFYKNFGYTEGLSGWITNDIFSGRIFCGGSSFAFKKEVIDKVYPIPEDIKRGTDYYITAMSSYFVPAEYIPDILGKYRFHSNNITMFAGQNNYKELASVNRDFAYMRQKLIDNIANADNHNDNSFDSDIIKRMQAKEIIFYNVLSGKRFRGIKHIPLLFKGKLPIRDLSKSITVSFTALFVPAFLFSKLLKVYRLYKKLTMSMYK